jgi:transposase-like protein
MNYTNLLEVAEYFKDKQVCIDYLAKMRWKEGVCCVYCSSNRIYDLKGKHKRYKCGECKRHFSVTVGSIFENSPIPLRKWFMAVHILSNHKKGISATQLALDLGVSRKTAWFMAHRVRYAIKAKSFEKMKGVIQVDETFVGGKNKNRHKDKKVAQSQGRSYKDKTPVMGVLQEEGLLYLEAIPNVRGKTLSTIINKRVQKGSTIVSDEWKGYSGIKKNYKHVVLYHARKQYSNEGYSTNRLEGFWSILKRGIIGIYHFVSRKHLQRYCDEFSFRYNMRNESVEAKFDNVFKNINCRLTYKELIGKK